MANYPLLKDQLSSYAPGLIPHNGKERAAVAMIVRIKDLFPEILMIERSLSKNDPWSGHLALPGGRKEVADPSLQATAVRETLEETGVDLSHADFLGRLSDVDAGGLPLVISCFVYGCPQEYRLHPEQSEVADIFWTRLNTMESAQRTRISKSLPEGRMEFPAVAIPGKQQPLWGITYKFVREACRLLLIE